jgi:hypothetical protein
MRQRREQKEQNVQKPCTESEQVTFNKRNNDQKLLV